jgi:predicted O-methyltransferase YrrM
MIVNPEIEKYILSLIPPRDEILAEMEALAQRESIPIVGPAVGAFLAVLVLSSHSKRIFELGSAIGYSTTWLARAAGPDAEIHYTDSSPANAERARRYLERAGLANRVQIHVGDALTALSEVDGEFDFIFNDVNKDGYPSVFRSACRRLRRGGLLVSDNTLWHERVLNPADNTSSAVVEFNTKLFQSNEFMTCLVPLRDGLTVGVKR